MAIFPLNKIHLSISVRFCNLSKRVESDTEVGQVPLILVDEVIIP